MTQQWRSYLAFVLSFMLVGINWANHRGMFATLARATHTLVWLNILYLMVGVAFVNPPLAVAGFVAVVFGYMLPVQRLVALAQQRRRAQSSHRG